MPAFKKLVSEHFRNVLAETRVPFNDVSLYDQTAATVAFFKAALADRVVAGTWRLLVNENSQLQYHWRSLSISLDAMSYMTSALKVGDMLGRREIIREVFDRIAKRIEIEFPLGSEIYRDEQRVSFLTPDAEDLLAWSDGKRTLGELIREDVLNGSHQEIDPDLSGALLKKGTRTVFNIGQQLSAPPPVNTPDPTMVQESWGNASGREICLNCGLRPQGPGAIAQDRNLCDTCLEQRESRAEIWCHTHLDQTIWLDEATDNNGRLALLVGQWPIDHWLDGSLWTSVLAAHYIDFQQTEQDAKQSFAQNQFTDTFNELVRVPTHGDNNPQFKPFYEDVIIAEWDEMLKGVPSITPDQNPGLITAMYLLSQNPSFPRLRRVWETTQQFWQDVAGPTNEANQTSLLAQALKASRIRLNISCTLVAGGSGDKLKPYHAYDLVLPGKIKLSVMRQNRGFITIDNLVYVAMLLNASGKPDAKTYASREAYEEALQTWGADSVRQALKDKELSIEEPTGYGSNHKELGKCKILAAPNHESHYSPVIPLLAEPRTFAAILPTSKAIDIIQSIYEKYDREMGRVRNRLPLTLGIVFFHRRTPLRAAWDAAQRMMANARSWDDRPWTIESVGEDDGQWTASLVRDDKRLIWRVPKTMAPQSAMEDYWYPYAYMAEEVEREKAAKALRPDGNSFTPSTILHISNLQAGDTIYFTPARLDMQWLDVSGRRFEIAYDDAGQRLAHPVRPYLLDEIQDIQTIWGIIGGRDGLTSSQIHALVELIEGKREAWYLDKEDSRHDTPFIDFCRNALANLEWKERPDKTTLEKLTVWAASGMLTDVVELYLKIMKRTPERMGQESASEPA